MEIAEIERAVFRKILANHDTLATNICKVSPEDFQNKLARMVIGALSTDGYLAHFAPNKNFFEILLREKIRDAGELERVSMVLEKMATATEDASDLELLIKEVKSNRMCREMVRIIQDHADNITPADVEKTYEAMVADLLKLPLAAGTGVSVSTIKEVHEELEQRIALYTSQSTVRYPTGLSAFDEAIGGFAPGEFVVITAGTGQGKCVAKGTGILKHSGEIVPVENIRASDLVMGPDSKPRRVLSTTSGTDEMYRITPTNGQPWVCNSQHILTLIHTVTGQVIDISIQDYIKKSKKFKHLYKQFFVGVDFPRQDKKLPIDPYFLGVWYGDGTKSLLSVIVTKPDSEIRDCVAAEAEKRGLRMSIINKKGKPVSYRVAGDRVGGNPLLNDLRRVVGTCETIPHEYLTASREDRAALLAGLLDTDGSPNFGGFDIAQKRKGLADGICFLARSLGLRAIMSEKKIAAYPDNTYYRVHIAGDCSILPMRIKRKMPAARKQNKNITRTGFTVEPIGRGEYFGFQLDGDGRFLLGDFTVTHNSNIMLWWAEQYVKAGANVVYVTIEMSYEETMSRYHAIATGYEVTAIGNKRIPEGKLPDYYKKLIVHAKEPSCRSDLKKEMDAIVEQTDTASLLAAARKYPNRKNKLFVLDIGAASPSRIEREVQRLSMDHKIDYVFVDFINVMDPEFHNRDKVKELSSIARDLKKVARRTKTILFSAAQLDTTSIEGKSQNEKISPDRVKYARAIAENSDWMIAFHRTEEDMRLKQIRLQLAKHRHSADCAALIEFDFATMQAIDLGKPDPAKASDMGSADNSKYNSGRAHAHSGSWQTQAEFE